MASNVPISTDGPERTHCFLCDSRSEEAGAVEVLVCEDCSGSAELLIIRIARALGIPSPETATVEACEERAAALVGAEQRASSMR